MNTASQGSNRYARQWWSVRRDLADIPSMAHFTRPNEAVGWFVVTDPRAGRKILDDGTVTTASARLGRAGQAMLIAWCTVLCGVLATLMFRGPSPAHFFTGAVLGLFLGGIVVAAINAIAQQRERARNARAGTALSWVVGPHDGHAWRLCEIVARTSNCPAWQDRTVDASRQIPAILWSAVGRSIAVEQRRRDAEQALRHDSLQQLARDTLDQVERETRSLDAVEHNLQSVLLTARRIQEHRAQTARDTAEARRLRAEEQQLRARLTQSPLSEPGLETDDQADRSAGVAAEVAAVAGMLADADRILRYIDRHA